MRHPTIQKLIQEHMLIAKEEAHRGSPANDPYTNMQYVGIVIDPLGLEIPVYFNPKIDPNGLHTLSSISGYMKVESQRLDIETKQWSTVQSNIQTITKTPTLRRPTTNVQPSYAGIGL